MIRGCLVLLIGFACGVALMVAMWPHPPAGLVAPPVSSDVRVFISDVYLARKVQSDLSAAGPLTVNDVQIRFAPPSSLTFRMQLSLGPLSTQSRSQLQPTVDRGRIRVQIISSEIAGIAIPSQLTAFVEDAINSRTNNLLRGNGRVVGVRVLPSGVEVSADVS